MDYLANISQFEKIQNGAIRNDNPTRFETPDSYRHLTRGTGAANVMGDRQYPAAPNKPSLPKWGARNSLGDLLLSMQESLVDYFKATKGETDKFVKSVDHKNKEVALFLDAIKHPAARQRLGLDDRQLKVMSNVVRDFYDKLKQQVYDVVYSPLADSCDAITQKIESKGDIAPAREEGFRIPIFGKQTLRSQFIKRLKDALKKGEITKAEYKAAKKDKSEEGQWGRERADYEKYRTLADELLGAQSAGTEISPELKQVMKWYGYDLDNPNRNKNSDLDPATRAALGPLADAMYDNAFFKDMGTQAWAQKHKGLFGKLKSHMGPYRTKKNNGGGSQNGTTGQNNGTGSQEPPKSNGVNQQKAPNVIDVPDSVNPALHYHDLGEMQASLGEDGARKMIESCMALKQKPENKDKKYPAEVWPFIKDWKNAH